MARKTTYAEPTRLDDSVLDALGSDPKTVEDNAGPAARVFIRALDRAVALQTGVIVKYVARLRRKNPEASPAQFQDKLDAHFRRLAAGSGAGVGAAAAIPGIGLLTGTAAIGAESLLFLDAAAFYTLASAHLRGVDVTDPQRRRALILVALLGSQGSAIVDTVVGDLSSASAARAAKVPATSWIGRLSPVKLGGINSRLLKAALKRFSKRLTRGWVGKVMPLGIGAVIGTVANRKLAKDVIANTALSFGPAPRDFTVELDELPQPTKEEAAVIDELDD